MDSLSVGSGQTGLNSLALSGSSWTERRSIINLLWIYVGVDDIVQVSFPLFLSGLDTVDARRLACRGFARAGPRVPSQLGWRVSLNVGWTLRDKEKRGKLSHLWKLVVVLVVVVVVVVVDTCIY